MSPEDIIEAFVITIFTGIMIIVVGELYYPNLTTMLVDWFPTFVEILAYVFIIAFFITLILQVAEDI